jgi:hypothetical protein
MEEAAENGKEWSHSAHANGMNELKWKIIWYRRVCENPTLRYGIEKYLPVILYSSVQDASSLILQLHSILATCFGMMPLLGVCTKLSVQCTNAVYAQTL